MRHVEAPTSAPGNLMKSPFPFQPARRMRPVGQQRVSRALAGCVDRPGVPDGAVVEDQRSRAGQLHDEHRLPDAGLSHAWGRGSRMVWARLSDNLPTFVVLPDPRGLPYNAKGNFTSGFLPQSHQGTILDAGSPRPIPDLFPPQSAAVHHHGKRARRPGGSASD